MAWPTIAWLPEAMILACLSVAAATDLASRIIPNRVTLLVLCAGIALRFLSGLGSLWPSLLGPVAVLATIGLLASRDFIGWGDAKLIAAVSVAVPADRLPTLLLAIALAGGLLSCLYLAARFLLRRAPGLAYALPGQVASSVPARQEDVDGRARPGHDEGSDSGDDGSRISLLPSPTWLAAIPRVASRERARILAGEPMPYAVAIAGGVLFTLATG
jgi:prepilin peptidase CpaA